MIIFPANDSAEKDGYGLSVWTQKVHGILAAPPCTKFSKAAWQIKRKDRDFKEGMKVVRACMDIIWYVQENNGASLALFTRTKRTALWGYFNAPRRTVRKRDFPYINQHSSRRDAVSKDRINKGWGSLSVEDRAKTSAEFAQGFFKANL